MSATAAPESTGRALPRGPHRLPREAVLSSQRGRLLDAMAEVVSAKGYAAVTVGDVVGRARVSRKTFYEHFSGKEDCFLAAYDAGVDLLVARIREAEASAPSFAARVRAGVRAYLGTLSSEPAFARTFLLEIAAAGPRALERRARVHGLFRARVARLHEDFGVQVVAADEHAGPPPAEALLTALVGGTDELVSEWVRAGRAAELPELESAVVHLHLSLFAGPETALESTP
ncbi:MAG: TetR/AcrR family transcriptional regulator [Thermoleophilaceae bacterium]|nr:TetR/AcrR family transcriptional regulator [Thermoleophilaceae bacterium]